MQVGKLRESKKRKYTQLIRQRAQTSDSEYLTPLIENDFITKLKELKLGFSYNCSASR